jgi:hypothetical protein
MAVRLINPDGLVTHPLYRQGAVAPGNTQIHLAGMVAWDEHGQLVAPDDLAGQVAQVYRANWERSMDDAFVAGTEERE